MTKQEESVEIIFKIKDWNKIDEMDINKQLLFLQNVIPKSMIYLVRVGPESPHYNQSIQRAQISGKREEGLGKTLYLLTDDTEIIHFVAIYKEYEPLVKALKRTINYDMFESFSAIDMSE